jgi:hypothetical protein
VVEKEDEEEDMDAYGRRECERNAWRNKALRHAIGDIVEREDWLFTGPFTRSVLGDLGSSALSGCSAVQELDGRPIEAMIQQL